MCRQELILLQRAERQMGLGDTEQDEERFTNTNLSGAGGEEAEAEKG